MYCFIFLIVLWEFKTNTAAFCSSLVNFMHLPTINYSNIFVDHFQSYLFLSVKLPPQYLAILKLFNWELAVILFAELNISMSIVKHRIGSLYLSQINVCRIFLVLSFSFLSFIFRHQQFHCITDFAIHYVLLLNVIFTGLS